MVNSMLIQGWLVMVNSMLIQGELVMVNSMLIQGELEMVNVYISGPGSYNYCQVYSSNNYPLKGGSVHMPINQHMQTHSRKSKH